MLNPNLLPFYTEQIEKNLWPFWQKAVDIQYGGVFTCFANSGEELLHEHKYTWSQGRFLWLCATLYELARDGRLAVDQEELQQFAEQTYQFLAAHTILPSGNILFTTTRSGELLEDDSSIFADGFFILGIARYAAVFQQQEAFDIALTTYDHAMHRVQANTYRTEPYPIREGFQSHSIPMIFLNVAEELAEAARRLKHTAYPRLLQDSFTRSEEILEHYIQTDGRIIEFKANDPQDRDSLLARHVNPGHAIESVWFHLHAHLKHKGHIPEQLLERMVTVTLYALKRGWDETHGGLLRFVDADGGVPKGSSLQDPMEKLITETHDTKLWWPHSEALYTTLLMHELTQRDEFHNWYSKLHEYAFRTFPHPDPAIGEWIQIRDRQGAPLQRVVALPVKDPFHILRNFILVLQLPDLLALHKKSQ